MENNALTINSVLLFNNTNNNTNNINKYITYCLSFYNRNIHVETSILFILCIHSPLIVSHQFTLLAYDPLMDLYCLACTKI